MCSLPALPSCQCHRRTLLLVLLAAVPQPLLLPEFNPNSVVIRHRRRRLLILGASGAAAGVAAAVRPSFADTAPGSQPISGSGSGVPLDKLACQKAVPPPRTPIVLVACGSFNPPTTAHMRMFDVATAALAEVCTCCGCCMATTFELRSDTDVTPPADVCLYIHSRPYHMHAYGHQYMKP